MIAERTGRSDISDLSSLLGLDLCDERDDWRSGTGRAGYS